MCVTVTCHYVQSHSIPHVISEPKKHRTAHSQPFIAMYDTPPHPSHQIQIPSTPVYFSPGTITEKCNQTKLTYFRHCITEATH